MPAGGRTSEKLVPVGRRIRTLPGTATTWKTLTASCSSAFRLWLWLVSRFLRWCRMFRGRFGSDLRRFTLSRFTLSMLTLSFDWRGRLRPLGLALRRRCSHWSHNYSRRSRALPLALHHFALFAHRNCSRRSRRCFRPTPAPGWRRRRRRRRRKRLQELQRLRTRPQFPVKQQHEHIARNLRILRQLRRDQQLRHLRQRNALLHLPPLGQEIFYLLRHSLMPCRHRQKQNHLRPRRRQQIPGARRRCRFFPGQPFRQLFGMVLNIAPGFDQILARNLSPQIRDVFVGKSRSQKVHHRRRWIDRIAQIHHLLPRLHQLPQPVRVHFGRRPMRMQHLQPVFFLERLHHIQRIIFMRQLRNLMSYRAARDVLDVVAFFRRVVAQLRALLQRPVKARRKSGSANQPRRILHERIVMQNPQQLRLNIRHAVERIKQQPTRPLIQRQRHRVHREVAPPQIVLNAGRRNHRSLAHLFVVLGVRHANLGAHIPRQHQKQRAHFFIVAGHLRACPLEVFLQFEGIALNREVQVADREPADNVPYRPAGKVESNSRGPGYLLHQIDAFHLIRRQPDFHRVNVISHSSSDNRLQALHPTAVSCTSQMRPSGMKSTAFQQDFHRLPGPTLIPSRPVDTQAIKYKALKQSLVETRQLKGITQG